MPIASGKTIDYMARMGLKAMVTLNGEKVLDQVVRAYRDACARHGRPKQLGEDLCWGVGLYLAESKEEAIRRLEPAHDERYQRVAGAGRALQVVRLVRLRALRRRAGPLLGHAGRAGARADATRGRRAEGVARGPSLRGDRHDPRDRGPLSRPRSMHDPLGRGPAARRVQGATALVRPRGDAGFHHPASLKGGAPGGYTPTG